MSAGQGSLDVRSRTTVTAAVGSGGQTDLAQVSFAVDSFSTDKGSKIKHAINLIPMLFSDNRSRPPLLCAIFNIFLIIFLTYLTESIHSMAFRSLIFIALFDLFSLITCLITIWVSRQPHDPAYSFGYARCEVLSVFSSCMLAMLGCVTVCKEGVEHSFVVHGHGHQPIDVNWLLGGMVLALSFHMFVTYGVNNPAMSHVVETASSSWLQEHVADVSRALCACIPGLDKILLPRINSIVLIGVSCGSMLVLDCILVSISQYQTIDSLIAIVIAVMLFGTMMPLSVYSGKILIQTTPSHIVGQLDKTLREISTLDGVLEFRNEHFWTIGFNNLCGSVHIRVRRDAKEQLVLAHVMSRLQGLAPNVTVQIFKDDWTQLSATTKFYYNRSASQSANGGHSHSHGGGSGGHSHSHGGGGGGHSHSHGDGGHSHSHGEDSSHGHEHSSHGSPAATVSSDQYHSLPSHLPNTNRYLNPSAVNRSNSPSAPRYGANESNPMKVI